MSSQCPFIGYKTMTVIWASVFIQAPFRCMFRSVSEICLDFSCQKMPDLMVFFTPLFVWESFERRFCSWMLSRAKNSHVPMDFIQVKFLKPPALYPPAHYCCLKILIGWGHTIIGFIGIKLLVYFKWDLPRSLRIFFYDLSHMFGHAVRLLALPAKVPLPITTIKSQVMFSISLMIYYTGCCFDFRVFVLGLFHILYFFWISKYEICSVIVFQV